MQFHEGADGLIGGRTTKTGAGLVCYAGARRDALGGLCTPSMSQTETFLCARRGRFLYGGRAVMCSEIAAGTRLRYGAGKAGVTVAGRAACRAARGTRVQLLAIGVLGALGQAEYRCWHCGVRCSVTFQQGDCRRLGRIARGGRWRRTAEWCWAWRRVVLEERVAGFGLSAATTCCEVRQARGWCFSTARAKLDGDGSLLAMHTDACLL